MLFAAGVLLLVGGVLVAAGTGTGPAGIGAFVTVVMLVLLGVLSVIVGGTIAWFARWQRFKAEGYALRFLLPRNPSLTAVDLGRHLNRTADFDSWQQHNMVLAPTAADELSATWTWSAGQVRPLLPGRPASSWQQYARLVIVAALLCGFVGIVTVEVNRTRPYMISTATITMLTLAIVCLIVAAGLQLGAAMRFRQEYAAGYATLVPRIIRRSTMDIYTGVDLVDVKTGHIIRAAGALPLTPQRLAARIAVLHAPTAIAR